MMIQYSIGKNHYIHYFDFIFGHVIANFFFDLEKFCFRFFFQPTSNLLYFIVILDGSHTYYVHFESVTFVVILGIFIYVFVIVVIIVYVEIYIFQNVTQLFSCDQIILIFFFNISHSLFMYFLLLFAPITLVKDFVNLFAFFRIWLYVDVFQHILKIPNIIFQFFIINFQNINLLKLLLRLLIFFLNNIFLNFYYFLNSNKVDQSILTFNTP